MSATVLAAAPVLAALVLGVTVGEAGRFAGYVGLVVVLPAIATVRRFGDWDAGLETVAVGAGVGLCFSLASGMVAIRFDRPFLAFVPALLVVLFWWPSRTGRRRTWSMPSPWTGVVFAAMLVYLAALMLDQPLARMGSGMAPYVDLPFHQALASSAKSTLPPPRLHVLVDDTQYHWFAHALVGSMSRFAGIETEVMVARLFPLGLLPIVTLQLAAFGRQFGRPVVEGAIAAGLVLLTGDLDLLVRDAYPFLSTLRSSLLFSPSMMLGLALFTPLLMVVRQWLARPRGGHLAIIVVLSAAALGTKGPTLPVLVAGLAAVTAARLLTGRSPRSVLVPLVLVGSVLAIGYPLLFAGGDVLTSGGLTLVTDMPGLELLARGASVPVLVPVALAASMGAVALGLFASPRGDDAWLLGGIAAAGMLAAVVLDHEYHSQFVFLQFGMVALSPLAARVITGAWRARGGADSLRLVARVAAVAVATTVGLLVLTSLGITSEAAAAPAGIVVALAVVAALAVVGSRDRGHLLAGLALGFAMLSLADFPVDTTGAVLRQAHAPQGPYGTEMLEGLRWVRANTPPDSVVAVDNHHSPRTGGDRHFYYSAYSERRFLLETWAYTSRHSNAGYPDDGWTVFPELWRVNRAVFVDGREDAVTEMASMGVTHLLHDVDHGYAHADLAQLGDVVFRNDALVVVRLPRQAADATAGGVNEHRHPSSTGQRPTSSPSSASHPSPTRPCGTCSSGTLAATYALRSQRIPRATR